MHDLMFANQSALSRAKYEEWAKQIGLNMDKFKKAVESNPRKARIEEDMKLGAAAGANGTPTMFINCRKVVGAQPFDAFKTVIDDEIKKADEQIKKGVKGDLYSKLCDENVSNQPQPGKMAVRSDDPIRGNPKAAVSIVMFSDFQCPFCGKVEPTLKQVSDTYKDQVKIIWKHEPLSFHPNAMPAALAAEAARKQGKFWEMHDLMFANQQALSSAKYEEWAKQIGLNMDKFKKDMEDPKTRARVEEDMKLATAMGADGTPHFFINGQKLAGAMPFESFKSAIDEELKKAQTARK
jgi:protein-disulfide isomerase